MAPKFVVLEELAENIGQVAEADARDIKTQYAVRYHDDESGFDSGSDSSSIMGMGNFEDFMEYLKIYSEGLMDLTPSLEDPARDFVVMEKSYIPRADDLLSVAEPTQSLVLILRDHFLSVDPGLLNKLGEANWQRYKRLQKKLANNQGIGVIIDDPMQNQVSDF